jgi:hypothetical protein
VVFWAAVGLLALAGAYFAALYEPAGPARQPRRGGLPSDRRPDYVTRPAAAVDVGWSQRQPPAREVRPTGAAESAPAPGVAHRLATDEAAAESVGRRFFAAFARYELGELNPHVAATLRASATGEFAAELISTPPRVPGPIRERRVAELRGLAFVPGRTDAREQEILTAELVGWAGRGDRRSPIAIDLARTPRGWRVAGIGR